MKKIEFQFNKQKAIEVILYLASKRPSLDRISLFKFLFFSDIEHLNKYGRPILGGHYVAMQLGPVPSQVCNLVKNSKKGAYNVIDYMITAERQPDLNYISQSDAEVMDKIYSEYGNLSAKELSQLSHKHPAWISAKKQNKIRNNNRIDFKDMINPENIDIIEDLEENGRYIIF